METVNPSVPSTIEAAALRKMADRGQMSGGDRARGSGTDYTYQPGRLAERTPRFLRGGGASRGGATQGCIQGDRMILLLASRHKTDVS
jgi:hypothetical protein